MISWLEIRRQLFHILLGIFLVVMISLDIINKRVLLVVLILGIFISLISKKYKIPVISWFLERFDRRNSFLPGYGSISFFVGSVLVLYLFEENIALASILIMSLGDGFATLIGKHGKIRTKLSKKKTLEGTFAGIVVSVIGASFFVAFHEAMIASIISMFVELKDFKLKNLLDDNILIPLIAGVVIFLLRIL